MVFALPSNTHEIKDLAVCINEMLYSLIKDLCDYCNYLRTSDSDQSMDMQADQRLLAPGFSVQLAECCLFEIIN